MQNRVQKKKKISLTTMIFIALLAGALAGVIINYLIPSNYVVDDIIVQGVFYIVGQGFIRLMRMLVVPLVFCSIVCGSMAVGDTKKLGSVGVKTLIFYLCTTALAITVALTIANIFNPGKGLDMSQIQVTSTVSETTQSMSMTETLLDIIPVNIFNSLSEGNMLQIIVFALILGVILANMGDRVDIVKNFFGQFNDIMMEMTMAVMKLAPIGVFCLIAKTFAEIGFEVFIPLLKYMFCVLLALAVQCFVVYLGLLKIFSGLNPFIFIKNFFPVMAFAFSTSTSNATIPMNIDTLAEKMGVSKNISSFTIPLGATINMDGTSIMQGVAVVFTAQAFGIPLDMMDYLTVIGTATLASIGTAGVPSVGLITLTIVFNSVGLPIEGIALIMGIDRILDMTRTAVNITGGAVCYDEVVEMATMSGVDVIPADMSLATLGVDGGYTSQMAVRAMRDLRDALVEDDAYDVMIFDCPPAFSPASIGAIAASSDVIIPLRIGRFEIEGMDELIEQIESVRKINPATRIAGALLTMWHNSPVQRDGEEYIRETCPVRVFRTMIRRTDKVDEAVFARKAITEWSPTSAAARDYRAWVKELMEVE